MKNDISSEQKENTWYSKGIIGKLTAKNRFNREEKLIKLLNINSTTTILDVGCGPKDRSISKIMKISKAVVGIDLFHPKFMQTKNKKFSYLQMDASDLSSMENNQFDVGLNFGMMEHIPEPKRTIILNEMFRVCKKVAIIVPHKYSFIEPHFKLPFFSLYPLILKTFIVKNLKLHGNGNRTYKETYERLQNSYFWLTKNKWKSYHKKAKSYNIWFGILLMNLIVIYNTK